VATHPSGLGWFSSGSFLAAERVNGTTKSGQARVVSIDAETAEVLRLRRGDQAAARLRAGDSWRGTDGYVFTTGWSELIYPDIVTSMMTKLIRASKQLPHARLHDLRHLHATTLRSQACCEPLHDTLSQRSEIGCP
jgi:integrase